jgi:hypothetical protein
MEFLIMLGMLGILTYELISGEGFNEMSRQTGISRSKHPGLFWFAVGFQIIILIWMFLELLGIVDIIN